MGSASDRRRNLVINPQLQRRMFLSMTVAPAIAMLLTVVVVCFYGYRVHEQAAALGVQITGLAQMLVSALGFIVVGAVFLVATAIMTSYRVAGPAYRLSQAIEKARDGDLVSRPSLRDGDYLVELCDEFNLFLDVLHENPPPGFKTRTNQVATNDADNTASTAADEAELVTCGEAEADRSEI